MCHDPADQDTTDPAVPVAVGVDRLKLCVGNGSLAHRVDLFVVDEVDEIVHQGCDKFGWWKDQRGVARRRSSDPGLCRAEHSYHFGWKVAVLHEATMPVV